MKFSAYSRRDRLAKLDGAHYDLVIIGGGITGAGTALAAARTGLKTLLVEKGDFAGGTSSRSSKMIHGGLRYLQQMNFGLVKESLSEREILLNLLPNQVYVQEYVYPVYEFSKNSRFEVKLGMIGYDLLAGSRRIGHHHQWTLRNFEEEEAQINRQKLTGGFVYHDCLVDDARLTLAAIQSAEAAGIHTLSYLSLVSLDHAEKEKILHLRDVLTHEFYTVSAATVVNCGGPWTDTIRKLAGYRNEILRPTKGIHLVFSRERLPLHRSVVIFGEDGRMIFTVPKGKYTYVGTTDTDYHETPDEVFADDEDVDYLLKAANTSFDKARLTRQDIISAWAGLRPLIGAEGDPSDVSRDFEILADDDRFLSIAGGKLTTFRLMGIRIIRELLKRNPEFGHSLPDDRTGADSPLWGGNIRNIDQYIRENSEYYAREWTIRESTVQRLITLYGTHFTLIARFGESAFRYIGESDILQGEILYQIHHEMALTLEDIMWRRLSLLLFDDGNGVAIAEKIVDIMARELNWDRKTKKSELQNYAETVAKSYGRPNL